MGKRDFVSSTALQAGGQAQHGSAIVICMLMLVLLSLLGIYATNTSTMEVRIAAHAKQATEALYAAESGISEGRARLMELTAAAPYTTDWQGFLGFQEVAQVPQIARELVSYTHENLTPSAQSTVPFLVRVRYLNEEDRGIDLCGDGLQSNDARFWGDVDGDGVFEENPLVCGGPTAGTPITVLTGWGISGAGEGRFPSIKKITAEVRREPLKPTLFGDVLLDIRATSSITAGTGAPNSAHIASNSEVRMSTGIEVEGEILLGRQADGAASTLVIADGSSVNAHGGVVNRDRMDPDPLGLASGPLEQSLQDNRQQNDNFIGASPSITDDTINLGATSPQGTAMTLEAGSYHLDSITIEEGCTLTIDNSSGPVILFIEGPFLAVAGSELQVLGGAERFIIFCTAESQLTLAHDGHFKGCIYAPWGTVTMQNSGNITGMIWAKQTILENTGVFSYEPKARSRFIRYRASLMNWRDR